MMTTEETAWDSLSYAGKNHILFERQKHLLEEFLVRNAISREQYEKKTMDEGVSASFLNEWNGSRNHREKIYFSYDSTDKKCQAAVKLSDMSIPAFVSHESGGVETVNPDHRKPGFRA